MNTREINSLKRQREGILERKDEIEEELRNAAYEYSNFFSAYGDKNFKFYKKLPTIEKFKAYIEYGYHFNSYKDNPLHPLDNNAFDNVKGKGYRHIYSYSYFDLVELSVLLRMIYQYQTGKEFGIVTTGNITGKPCMAISYPNLYFIVGEKKKLEKYEEDQAVMYEDENKFSFEEPESGLLALRQIAFDQEYYDEDHEIRYPNIRIHSTEFLTTIDYNEYKCRCLDAKGYFGRHTNIFKPDLKANLDSIKSHKDLFSFGIAKEDNFISYILYSIMMYKMKNHKIDLTDEDYQIIIKSLFGNNIGSVSEEAVNTLPKTFKYVISPETRAKYENEYELNENYRKNRKESIQ